MSTTRLTDSLRSAVLLALAAVIVSGAGGCSRMWSSLFIHIEEKHDLAEVRRDTRRELADQREEARRDAAEDEVEQARLNSERAQWEKEFCRCNKEAEQERLRANIRETVESKVAFNVEHGLEIGELEVDTEKLKEMLHEREQPRLPVKQPCPCCDAPCTCGSGFIRRHCPHCRHKHCEAEKDCGGPEALERLAQQPLKQPLRPAEIPLKLPVYLSFGMQQPEMERARIRRQPVYEEVPCKPCTAPCTEPCRNYYQHGLPRVPCTTPVPGSVPPVGASPPSTAPQPPAPLPMTSDQTHPADRIPVQSSDRLATPPVPIADPSDQARHLPLVSIQPTNFLQEAPAPQSFPGTPLR